MTKLDDIRGELKKAPAYDPDRPIGRDLLERVVNDLAIEMGADGAYIMDVLEQLASDTLEDDKEAPEQILKTLFDVLGRYQSGQVKEGDSPIQYTGFRLQTDPMKAPHEQIQEFAVRECGWPIGTVAVISERAFELNYNLKDRRAYVLRHDGAYHVPIYGKALFAHIEKRDQAIAEDFDLQVNDDGDFRLDRSLARIGRSFGTPAAKASSALAALAGMGVSSRAAFGAFPRSRCVTKPVVAPPKSPPDDMTDAITFAVNTLRIRARETTRDIAAVFDSIHETVTKFENAVIGVDEALKAPKATPKATPKAARPVSWPLAAPRRPEAPQKGPGRHRSPERRSRAPPDGAE